MSEEKSSNEGLRKILAGVGALLGFSLLAGDFMGGVIAELTNSDFLGKSSGMIGIIAGGLLGYYALELISIIVVIVIAISAIAMFR